MKKYFSALLITAFVSINAFSQVEIDNANNVGIGIATPTQKLDVNGTLRIRSVFQDNSLQQVLVQDPLGTVHFRDAATIGNSFWTKVSDTLFSDTISYVHINGKNRTRIGNTLFDICPIPGPPVGIGGGIHLIFNKDNVCVGKFIWEEKIFLPIPSLPDPVFKLFPRTGGTLESAPGLELATFDTIGLGLDGIRMMLCPSPLGPFPLWDNPRIDLELDNEILINPGGATGGLRVSNLGSSGCDGVSLDIPEDELRLGTKDSATAKVAEARLIPDFPAESFFDVMYDLPIHRLRLSAIDDGLRTGLGLHLSERQLIEGYGSGGGGGGGRLSLYPDDGPGRDHLTVSNIGSSGQDGVRMALADPLETALVALDLISSAPIPLFCHGAGNLITEHGYDSINGIVRTTVADTGSSAAPHVYEYDAINEAIRELGPHLKSYESKLMVHTSLFDSLNRTIVEAWNGNLPGESPQAIELDLFLDQMRLVAGLVQVNGDLDATGIVSGPVKNFKIDHPLDPLNKNLIHVSVESPDMMNIYNGNIVTDKDGNAIVEMPDYFSALNMDFRYQLTTIGQQAQAWIGEEIDNNTFKIKTDKANVKVSWQVTGIRNDTYAKENRVQVEVAKDEAMKGTLLYESKKELGLNKR